MIKGTFSAILIFCTVFSALIAATEYDSIRFSVNDRVITKNEIEMRLFEMLSINKIRLDSVRQVADFRQKAIDSLIEEALIDSQAEKLMIYVTDDQLDEAIDNRRKQQKMGQAEFEEALERQQETLANYRKIVRRSLRRNQVLDREIRSKIEIKEDSLKKLYGKEYSKIVRVHARHILLRLNANAPDEEVDKVRKKTLELKKEIESGKSFEEMATLFSEDPTAKRNQGDLGFFKKQDMRKEFSDAAFALSPGAISDPVRTPFGFHLIEVLEKKEDSGESFSAVRTKLYQQEYQKVFVRRYKQYIDQLKDDAQIARHR
jgi:peptidyl-prolyl cis-trans isomerase SurA